MWCLRKGVLEPYSRYKSAKRIPVLDKIKFPVLGNTAWVDHFNFGLDAQNKKLVVSLREKFKGFYKDKRVFWRYQNNKGYDTSLDVEFGEVDTKLVKKESVNDEHLKALGWRYVYLTIANRDSSGWCTEALVEFAL